MTDRTPDDPGALADPTRDIALPPLPDRPPPALPKEWAGLRPAVSPLDSPTTAVPEGPRPPADLAREADTRAEPEAAEPSVEEPSEEQVEGQRLARARTDELPPQPAASGRERTLAFTSPEMRHRPIEPVQVGSTPRRWSWVVLTLLPILIIVGSAIAWVVLLDGV
ncbi:hypothetical protein [Candidatus Blastococcus massiliensis]|uniref:hypothetical protein n=1 Tax=Candidatus Blastococcus massiliensis TaxID=1470358 RepID=UPI0012DDB668|nr:hypothetical protein [Candidatus Blastococcus massiliensis]